MLSLHYALPICVRHERKDTVAGEFLVGAGFSRESRFALAPESPTVPALLLRSGRRWREAPDEGASARSEEHTSELQSLMRISYAVFCLKKKKNTRKARHE